MKLYEFTGSPFCEKIRMALAYKELAYDRIDAVSEEKREELYRISGRRMVPVLVDGDKVIIDSTYIAQYLEGKWPQKPIYPASPELRGLTLLAEDWADEVLSQPIRGLSSSYRLKQELPQEEREKLEKELNTHLSTLDQTLAHGKWLVGNSLTVADLAAYAQIWRITAFPPGKAVEKYAHVMNWKKKVEDTFGR